MSDIIWSCVYSNETWNNYVNMANQILGHNANNNDIVSMQADIIKNNASREDIRRNYANSKVVADAVVQMGNEVTGLDMSIPGRVAWRQNIQTALGNGMTFSEAKHNVVFYDKAVTDQIVNMSNKKGVTLTGADIEALRNLVEKQGMNLTQQQFDKVYNLSANISKDIMVVDTKHFAKYYQMVANNESDAKIQGTMIQDIANDHLIKPTDPYEGYPYTVEKEILFAIRHPEAALVIGLPGDGRINISQNSVRFATSGGKSIEDGDGLALQFKQSFEGGSEHDANNPTEDKRATEGTQVNAARHFIWQATISNWFGSDVAKEAGDLHEKNPNADTTKRLFKTIEEADEVIDLLNNQIARNIGSQYKTDQTMKTIANRMLDEFYNNGLYTMQKTQTGEYQVVKTKLPLSQYNHMKDTYSKLDNVGK